MKVRGDFQYPQESSPQWLTLPEREITAGAMRRRTRLGATPVGLSGFHRPAVPHKCGQSQIGAGSAGDKAGGVRRYREEIGPMGVGAGPQRLAPTSGGSPSGKRRAKVFPSAAPWGTRDAMRCNSGRSTAPSSTSASALLPWRCGVNSHKTSGSGESSAPSPTPPLAHHRRHRLPPSPTPPLVPSSLVSKRG